MSDLRKLVDDLSGLTAIETEELAVLLGEQSGVRAAQAIERLQGIPHDVPPSLHDLTTADWLVAESVSLVREAKDLARSLDDTLDYVRSRCDAVRRAA